MSASILWGSFQFFKVLPVISLQEKSVLIRIAINGKSAGYRFFMVPWIEVRYHKLQFLTERRDHFACLIKGGYPEGWFTMNASLTGPCF
jgi:hypothetical protein